MERLTARGIANFIKYGIRDGVLSYEVASTLCGELQGAAMAYGMILEDLDSSHLTLLEESRARRQGNIADELGDELESVLMVIEAKRKTVGTDGTDGLPGMGGAKETVSRDDPSQVDSTPDSYA